MCKSVFLILLTLRDSKYPTSQTSARRKKREDSDRELQVRFEEEPPLWPGRTILRGSGYLVTGYM